MKQLTPTTIDDLDNKIINDISKEIIIYLKDVYYNKIKEIYSSIFKREIKYNSLETDLLKAIKNNQIKVIDNIKLKGQFNARLTKYIKEKLGGKYNARKKEFTIEKLPIEITNYINNNKRKIEIFNSKLNEFLNEFTNNLDYSINNQLNINLNNVMLDINNKINDNLKDFIVKPTINTYTQQRINDEYINNMKLTIKNWQNENISKLRKEIQDLTLNKGYSNKSIEEYIENNYNTTYKKAKRLARNETSLVLSEYSKQKYIQNGITRYRWQTSGDERVRSDHQELNGKIFEFNNPPITDKATGARANPGNFYNCRCIAVPILDNY